MYAKRDEREFISGASKNGVHSPLCRDAQLLARRFE